MASEARIAANRRNAAKSTGPRTLVGKALVAQNALKHGLFAQQDLIAGEDPQQYQEYCRRFLAELNPSGERQGLLAGRIVSLAWRLKRAERLQNELFEFLLAREIESSLAGFADQMSEQDIERMNRKTETNPAYAVGRMLAWDYRGEKTLDKLSLHEQRIEGSLYRTMKELDRVQAGQGASGSQSPARDGWQRQEESSELAAATQIGVVGGSVEQSQSAAASPGQPVETQHLASLDPIAVNDLCSAKQSQSGEVSSVQFEVSGGDSAKQSQLEGVSSVKSQVSSPAAPAAGDKPSCETKPTDGPGAECVKQSQSGTVEGGQSAPCGTMSARTEM